MNTMDISWLGLENKTVIVTGGASGIGRAVAEELLTDGANVVACDMNPMASVFENASENRMLYLTANVADRASVDQMI